MLTAAWEGYGQRDKNSLATDPPSAHSSLNLVGIKETVPTPYLCSVVMALHGGNGRAWLMLLLMVTICTERMRMVLVMLPVLGFYGHELWLELWVMVEV